jgi:hypothetical protein
VIRRFCRFRLRIAASRSISLREIVGLVGLEVDLISGVAAIGTAWGVTCAPVLAAPVLAERVLAAFPADALRFAILPPYGRLEADRF